MLTLYSRERGKVRALAKGVRKTHSRKAGHLEPFTHVSLQLAVGRNWFVISQAEAQETFNHLRESLDKIGFASYLIELVDKFTYEEEENAPVFHLLVQTLRRLNRGDPPNLVTRYFEIRLLDNFGFRPELINCVVSGEEILSRGPIFLCFPWWCHCSQTWKKTRRSNADFDGRFEISTPFSTQQLSGCCQG